MLALFQLLLSTKQHLFDFPVVVKLIPYFLVFPVNIFRTGHYDSFPKTQYQVSSTSFHFS
jgi:hypothetical protein